MKPSSPVAALALALGAGACGAPSTPATTPPSPTGTATSPTTGPAPGTAACAGPALDLDAAWTACATHEATRPPPPPSVLALGLADVAAVSGQPTTLVVTARNASTAPLHLVFTPGCSFEVTVFDADGHIANQEGNQAMGGLCGTGAAIALTLDPGGTLTKRVAWQVRKDHLACGSDNVCHEAPGSPIAPGTYRVEVMTPFADRVGGDPHHLRSRAVSATLTVTAAPSS